MKVYDRAPTSDPNAGVSRIWAFPWITFMLIAIPFGWPLLNESTLSPCNAAESYTFSLAAGPELKANPMAAAMMGELQGGISHGAFVAGQLKQQWPNVPTPLSCTMLYWYLTFNPAAVPSGGVNGVPRGY